MATRKRKTATKRPLRRRVTKVARKSRKTTARKTKKGTAKKKRSLLYSLKTCSGSGYYLKVSPDGRIRSVAGRGLRCKCGSASRPGCKTKRKK